MMMMALVMVVVAVVLEVVVAAEIVVVVEMECGVDSGGGHQDSGGGEDQMEVACTYTHAIPYVQRCVAYVQSNLACCHLSLPARLLQLHLLLLLQQVESNPIESISAAAHICLPLRRGPPVRPSAHPSIHPPPGNDSKHALLYIHTFTLSTNVRTHIQISYSHRITSQRATIAPAPAGAAA